MASRRQTNSLNKTVVVADGVAASSIRLRMKEVRNQDHAISSDPRGNYLFVAAPSLGRRRWRLRVSIQRARGCLRASVQSPFLRGFFAARYGLRAVRVVGSSAAVVVQDCAEAAESVDAR